MTLSDTIRDIRLSKGLSQKQVSNGFLSQGNYSKFENETIEINASTFIGILNNLNIELEEFLYIKDGYRYSDKERIFRDFFRVPVNSQALLENLVLKCEIYLETNADSLVSLIKKISLFLIESIKSSDIYFNKEQAKDLLEEFSRKEHLYIKDLYLINSIFFLFPIESADLTMEYIDNTLKKYGDFQSINRLEVNLRMNYSLMLIKENLEENALQQINRTLPLVKKYKLSVQMGILYIRMGICHNNLKMSEETNYIEKGLAILAVLEENDILANMNKEINKYLQVE
ncbi:helix-turn-helix domain-containing protein [Solibacillus daqui]|uniref:helix-turn-helix domain-containing protein n=1 Tax=Solibacillus daqui TaxID=2912187 RepID=UPI0023669D38|nr:helix-turn-helix transcriptional regulator [Solibacillus daqui]